MKHLFKKALTFVLAVGMCQAVQAQMVRGGVKDANGDPIIGASVTVVGTTLGVSTNLDGSFELNVPDAKKDVITVSYIGMKEQTIPVNGRTHIDVVLEEDATTLNDVVVIGYGTVKRRDLTGSVASVTGDKLAANPVSNVAEALQGQLPGVSVTSQDGRPGASMSIRVRGGNSITQSNEPLLIVDGIQVSSIDDIPADNIESIDVLKDAASTAIYGARGANGVILITTKSGTKESKTTVRYNMYYQVKEKPDLLETLDAYDYVLYTWSQAYETGDSYADGVAEYFGLGSKYGNHLEDYRNVKAHNWSNDVLRSSGQWNHDISVQAGTDKTQYYASINYLNDDGALMKSGFRRWNANFKISQKLAKTLTFDADLRYADMKTEGNQFGVATSAYQYRPIDEPFGNDSPGLVGQGGSTYLTPGKNSVDVLNNYTSTTYRQRIRAMGALTWQAFKGFTAKTELSLSRNWSQSEYWDAGTAASSNTYNNARLTKGEGYGIRWATTLNYEVQGLGEDHSLSFLVGNEVLASKSNSSRFDGYGYPSNYTMDDAFGMMDMFDNSVKPATFVNSIGTPAHTVSFFARANYSLKGKYLFTGTFRADGSSKFGPNNHWGYFPAGAFAWRLSDEGFLENSRDWLDNLKLRLSVGTSGADNIDSTLWKSSWKTTTNAAGETVYQPNDMRANPDLKWETTISRNLGVDFSFWNGRLFGSVDAYWNTTKDILMQVPTAAATGYTYQMANVGQTSNKGIELALGASLVRKPNFNLNFNVTYSYNKNNIDKINADVNADTSMGWASSAILPKFDYVIREGQPVGLVMGYVSQGFYTVDDFDIVNGLYTLKAGVPDLDANLVSYLRSGDFPVAAGQTAYPGMPKFKDVDGNGKIEVDDVDIIGRMMPNHTGGFSLSGNWKNLDFSAGFTYQIGGQIYNANAMWSLMGDKDNRAGSNKLHYTADAYRIYDVDANGDIGLVTDPAQLNALNVNAKYPMAHSQFGPVTSDFIEDASYLRLQNLTIGYTLPKSWLQKIRIEKIRIYFTGTNLFCLTGYSGLDPDINTSPDGVNGFPTPNYDYNAYPKMRTYTFGLNLTF